jgi:hypothetical protein
MTYSFRQMSMPKPVGPNIAAATPSARREPRRRRSSTPGRSSWTRSHPPSASVFPEGAARKVSASVRRAHIRDTSAASGPGPGTWKDPDSRRRSSRGSGGLRLGLSAWQWRLREACGLSRLNHFLALWSQAYMPSCNRRVTSTSIHMARPGPATAPRGHAPLYADTLSLTRTISDRRFFAHLQRSCLRARRLHIRQFCARKSSTASGHWRGPDASPGAGALPPQATSAASAAAINAARAGC